MFTKHVLWRKSVFILLSFLRILDENWKNKGQIYSLKKEISKYKVHINIILPY